MIPAVEKLMTPEIYSITSERSVKAAAEEMAESEIGSLLVNREGDYIGIITEGDIVRKVVAKGMDPSTLSVEKAMTSPLITIEVDRSIVDANDLMEKKKVRHLGVTKKGKIIGVISVRDLLQPLYKEQKMTGF
jgi:CBS domain-containing protein